MNSFLVVLWNAFHSPNSCKYILNLVGFCGSHSPSIGSFIKKIQVLLNKREMANKRKHSSSLGFEQEQKRSRDMTVLEKNDILSNYLDTLIPGATAPEQQLSFEMAAKLAKPGILDIDDDNDDNLTAEERYCIERDSTEVVAHADEYNSEMSSLMKTIRSRNTVKMRTPVIYSSDESDGMSL